MSFKFMQNFHIHITTVYDILAPQCIHGQVKLDLKNMHHNLYGLVYRNGIKFRENTPYGVTPFLRNLNQLPHKPWLETVGLEEDESYFIRIGI